VWSIVSKAEPNTARKVEARKTERNFHGRALRSAANEQFTEPQDGFRDAITVFREFGPFVCCGLMIFFRAVGGF
jgi:hypothetical protein